MAEKVEKKVSNSKMLEKVGVATVAKDESGKTISQLLTAMSGQIAKALPKHMTAERMTRIALTATKVNPKLLECSWESLAGAIMAAAQLGLEPNTPLGLCYLIPYGKSIKDGEGKWHKIQECQFQMGYQGKLELAHRSGKFQMIYAEVVHDGDLFEYQYGLHKDLKHIPADEHGESIFYYAVYKTHNGGYDFKVMSKKQIIDFAQKHSKNFSSESSVWKTNFDEMAKKTVISAVLKYAPKSIELANAEVLDGSTRHYKDGVEDITTVISEEYSFLEQVQETVASEKEEIAENKTEQ